MGNLRRSNDIILAKIESTYGTDPTPTVGTNAIFVFDCQPDTDGLRMIDRPGLRATNGDLQGIFAGQLMKLTMSAEVKANGSAGVAPEIGPLLRACGLGETIVASTSVTYKPVSTNYESITLWYYEGGRKLHKLTGCRGNVKLTLKAGNIPMADFEFIGHVSNPTDVALPAPTYSSEKPWPLIGITGLTVNGVAVVAQQLTFDLGNTLERPDSLAATDGYAEIQITDRKVTGVLSGDSELASFIDYDTLLSAGTAFAITTGTIGTGAGKRLTISTPSQAYFMDRKFTEGNAQRRREMPFGVADAPTTDSEISIAFT